MACKNITVRKKKGKLAMGRQYLIHFAGGAAFVVRVFGKVLTVYTSKYSPDITAGKQVYRTNIKKLFVPSSLKPGVALPKRMLNGKSLKDVCDIGLAGNSLLAQIGNDDGTSNNDNQFKYLYIGHDVVEVTLDEPVEGYYSALGVLGTLDDPKLEMFAGAATFATNDNWGGGAALSNAFVQVGAFAYTAGNSRDAALFNAATPPRDYTVRVSSGVAGASGAVIAELYDATAASAFTATTARLINVSVRKHLGSGLTMGFVVGGATPAKVLVRGIGPTLGAFGVPGTVVDPQLTLFNSSSVKIGENNDWAGTAELTAAFANVGAFALPATSKDAALLVTLAPGNYTAQVTGVNGTTGVALVEVYEVP